MPLVPKCEGGVTVPESNTVLECNGIHHWFGSKHVLHDVNLKISRGQIVAIVGPSGCGKSTLFRAIVGTHPPCQGDVVICGTDGNRRIVREPGRDRGIVYQNYALFDFLTVLENVAFGLMLDETSIPFRFFQYPKWRKLRSEHEAKAEALLKKVGLGEAISRYPSELSGGMRQRVAIAQALIMEPDVLLLDEPFGALDEATREELQRMLLSLYAENTEAMRSGRESEARTILMVTHELTEAIFVSDRVLGLSQFWDWQGAGLEEAPGATIVYDKAATIFSPDDTKRHEDFVAQREEIYHAVFEPSVCQAHDDFVHFWKEVHGGDGKGVVES